MKKIGFIDYYLSEWHANNYPIWIAEAAKTLGLEVKVEYSFALMDKSLKDGVTTDEWCKKFNVTKCETIEELVDKSDYIIVLAPDNPEFHFQLSEYALRSGKPVYVDKTFATSSDEARKMLDIAAKHKTPVCTSSALRFASEIEGYQSSADKAQSVVVVGPGNMEVYFVHPTEMLVAVMKPGAKRIMCTLDKELRCFAIEYHDGRKAMITNCDNFNTPYQIYIEDNGSTHLVINSDFFKNFTYGLLKFFSSQKEFVDANQTIEVMSIIDSARIAIQNPLKWIEIN